jgi:hypothetical protein
MLCSEVFTKSAPGPHFVLLTYVLTYLYPLCSRVPFWEADLFSASQESRKFIPAFTSARHLSLSWASSIQSIPPHPPSWRANLILSSHLRFGLPSGLFPSGFPTKILYKPFLSPISATCPAQLILVDSFTQSVLDEEYRSLSTSLYSLLHYHVSTSFLGPNILLHTLISNTLSLHSSLNVCGQVSYPYKEQEKLHYISQSWTDLEWLIFCHILNKNVFFPKKFQ